MLDDFASTHPAKYRSDFDEFLLESKMEDFGRAKKGSVVVSTIHKSKGREFDNVYIKLDKVGPLTDERRRATYVGITRAKKRLRIHYSDKDLFSAVQNEGVTYIRDDRIPVQPDNVIVNLSHKDVVLDYFIDKKKLIFELQSGFDLEVDGVHLIASVMGCRRRIVKFSEMFVKKLEALAAKGYRPKYAKVRYVVAWKKDGCDEEVAVVLPDLLLGREK